MWYVSFLLHPPYESFILCSHLQWKIHHLTDKMKQSDVASLPPSPSCVLLFPLSTRLTPRLCGVHNWMTNTSVDFSVALCLTPLSPFPPSKTAISSCAPSACCESCLPLSQLQPSALLRFYLSYALIGCHLWRNLRLLRRPHLRAALTIHLHNKTHTNISKNTLAPSYPQLHSLTPSYHTDTHAHKHIQYAYLLTYSYLFGNLRTPLLIRCAAQWPESQSFSSFIADSKPYWVHISVGPPANITSTSATSSNH